MGRNCQGPDLVSNDYFCSLPKTIILCPKKSLIENTMPPSEFNLEICVQTAFPLVSKEYRPTSSNCSRKKRECKNSKKRGER